MIFLIIWLFMKIFFCENWRMKSDRKIQTKIFLNSFKNNWIILEQNMLHSFFWNIKIINYEMFMKFCLSIGAMFDQVYWKLSMTTILLIEVTYSFSAILVKLCTLWFQTKFILLLFKHIWSSNTLIEAKSKFVYKKVVRWEM